MKANLGAPVSAWGEVNAERGWCSQKMEGEGYRYVGIWFKVSLKEQNSESQFREGELKFKVLEVKIAVTVWTGKIALGSK